MFLLMLTRPGRLIEMHKKEHQLGSPFMKEDYSPGLKHTITFLSIAYDSSCYGDAAVLVSVARCF